MKLSPSQFTKYEESPGKWIGYITGTDKVERDTYFTIGSVIHSIIEGYNRHGVRHLEDIDKLIKENLAKNNITDVTAEELEKINKQISFSIENYMMSSPERHEQPEAYLETKINGHLIRGYVDAIGVDYKSVSSFCDPEETSRTELTTYRKYQIGAMIYAVLLHDNNIKIDKYRYIEISKADTTIKENTTYTIDKLIEIIQAQGVTDSLAGLQKKQLINLYSPRKQGINVVEFPITEEFLAQGREYITTMSNEMKKTLEAIQKQIAVIQTSI